VSDTRPRDTAAGAPTYALGHSAQELARLEQQSQFYRAQTERFLRLAGVAEGQHVLDVGCGVGDVAFLAGELVGPGGSVLAVDRALPALETARARAHTSGRRNIVFAEADLVSSCVPVARAATPFDAVIGRFVLMYVTDPIGVLRYLSGLARPVGVVAFLEMDLTHPARAWPPVPLWDRCMGWIRETYVRAGIETDPGLKLRSWFSAAGLTPHFAEVTGRVEGGGDSPAYAYIANTLRSLLPMAEKFGVATAAEVAIDSLAERLSQEVVGAGAAMHLPLLVGVAAHVPGPSV
jgi:ubiquinone/menaquinone biosynthesis C-methylase UbiE